MKAGRRTYLEYYLDSLDDSTLVSVLPFISKMAGSEEASESAMSGFFHDLERVLLEVMFVRFARTAGYAGLLQDIHPRQIFKPSFALERGSCHFCSAP